MADDDRYVPLGRTALRVGRIALGTVNFGGRVDDDTAVRMLDRALDGGANLVDTADIYGWRVHPGHTEELLGRWFAGNPSRRERTVLATKVGNPTGPGPNDRGLSARHLIAGCEASLRRLGTDWVDLYQLHTPDPAAGWDEVWQAVETLVAQGKVRYAGTSNFAGWQLAAGQEAARRRHFPGITAEQCVYNLAVRHAELDVIPAARAYGVGVLVWSPLHGGLLGGVLRKTAEGTAVKSAQGRGAEALPALRDEIGRYEEFCASIGRPPAEVGLAWLLSRPGVTALVTGPRTEAQLDGALAAADLRLSAAELDALDALFPPLGSGGPAPAAWIT
jgi:NDP-hexose 2,3-enoyl reductase